MMTAMLCVENILADAKLYDLWQVNSDAEYHEQGLPQPRKQTGARYGSSRPAWSLLPSSLRKGSARVSRAGERVLAVANFSWRIAEDQIPRDGRLFRRDAETNTEPRALSFSNSSTGGRTEKISITVNVVDSRNSGPEFMFARPRRGKAACSRE